MTREERFVNFFSHLTPENLDLIETIFASDAHFKDPFNDVIGREAIRTIFSHMFTSTVKPRFIVNHFMSDDEYLYIQWDFTFISNKKDWKINGCSVVTFNQKDEVQQHIDYWDPAEQIYSKVKLLKPLINFLVNRLKAR